MELNDKVTQLEDEIKILKNEVQSVLLDLRESFLSNINPFNPSPIVTQIVTPVENDITETTPDEPIDQKEPEQDESSEPDISGIDIEDEEEIEDIETDDETEEDIDDIFDIEEEDLDEDVEMETPSFVAGSNTANGFSGPVKEENKMVWHPEIKTQTQFAQKEAVTVDESKLGLDMIENLSQWVEDSVNRLGPSRTRTILDITETMGYVKSDLKNILVKFIHPVADEESISATTRDYLSVLVELNNLLMTDNRMEIALLFILITYQEYDNR